MNNPTDGWRAANPECLEVVLVSTLSISMGTIGAPQGVSAPGRYQSSGSVIRSSFSASENG